MVTVLAGLRFLIEPDEGLSGCERERLGGIEPPTGAPMRADLPLVRIVLEPRAHVASAAEVPARPARVSWTGERLLLRHAAFEADLDPATAEAVVRRDPGTATGLVTTLRTALCARLPMEGGVVLHAAGLEHRGRGFVFFGPSGIGKTTLALRSPWPMLSDELVAVLPRREGEPYRVAGTAFPGPLPCRKVGCRRHPSQTSRA